MPSAIFMFIKYQPLRSSQRYSGNLITLSIILLLHFWRSFILYFATRNPNYLSSKIQNLHIVSKIPRVFHLFPRILHQHRKCSLLNTSVYISAACGAVTRITLIVVIGAIDGEIVIRTFHEKAVFYIINTFTSLSRIGLKT